MNLLSEECQIFWQNIDCTTKDTMVYGTSTSGYHKMFVSVEKFHRWMCIIFRAIGTGGVDGARIMVASTANGTGATSLTSRNSTECTGLLTASTASYTGGGDNPTSHGVGQIVFEGLTKDLDSTLADGAFLAAQVAADTATDEFGVLWILSDPRYPQASLTTTGNGSTW
jgi:hypothetical protein